MTPIDEVESALSKLSVDELHKVESMIHRLYKERGEGLVYSDDYGDWSEDDQIALAGATFDIVDSGHADSKAG